MSSDESSTAATRLAKYFQPDGFPRFTLDEGQAWTSRQVHQVLVHHREFLRGIIEPTVRAVLAENREMRRQIDGLRRESVVLWYDDEGACWRPSGFTTVAAAVAEEGGQLQWREGSRLVGSWQPADGQHDPKPPVTDSIVSNDADKGLTC